MPDVEYHLSDRIAALATPAAKSALAVVRTSGDGVIERIATICSKRNALLRASGYTALHAELVDHESRETVDEVMLVVYRSPRSYTGEDAVDIMPHGSLPGIRRILALLRAIGFRDARPGEFTLRAFLNGKMDLTQAEAVREVVDAKTAQAHAVALERLGGRVRRKVDEVRERLVRLAGRVELALDYPEEEIEATISDAPFDSVAAESLAAEIRTLLDGFAVGRVYQEGIRVVIAGATNVGKSSLFNFLLREERAIVSELDGTTRDYIESWISIGGIPVRLFDTAGLRTGVPEIETEGIRRAEALVDSSDLVVYLVEATKGLADRDVERLASIDDGKLIRVFSKADLVDRSAPDGFIRMSTVTGEGLNELEQAILGRFGRRTVGEDAVLIESDRQRECLQRALDGLDRAIEASDAGLPLDAVAIDLSDSLAALGELTGEITRADILDVIFSNFCVGK